MFLCAFSDAHTKKKKKKDERYGGGGGGGGDMAATDSTNRHIENISRLVVTRHG